MRGKEFYDKSELEVEVQGAILDMVTGMFWAA